MLTEVSNAEFFFQKVQSKFTDFCWFLSYGEKIAPQSKKNKHRADKTCVNVISVDKKPNGEASQLRDERVQTHSYDYFSRWRIFLSKEYP